MNRSLWIPLIAVVCLLAGCGQKPWVGEWQGKKSMNNVKMDVDLTLRRDGTFVMKQTAVAKGSTADRVLAGYYTVDSEQVIFTVSSMTYEGKTIKTAEYQPPQPFSVKEDKLTYGKDAGKLELTRVKAKKN